MEEFLVEYNWIALLVLMIVEFLIGASKIKSNSTIEMIINMIKFIFKIEKK